MDKDTSPRFVGQPIFSQVLGLIDWSVFGRLTSEHRADRYYKTYSAKVQLITILFGILSRCDSMTEVCEGLRAMGGKLNHLGLAKSPAKSTACDGLRNRDSGFFEALYFALVHQYSSFLSDSRTLGLTFKEVLLIDSTTIRLFSDILKGVGRNPKNDGRKKGGLKVHMLIDAVQSVGRFIMITAAKVHDKNFLAHLDPVPFSMLVFDRAYNHYAQFALWTQRQVYFVTRLKSNAVYTVIETLREHDAIGGTAMVLREEIIEIEYRPQGRRSGPRERLRLKKVSYRDGTGRHYEFISNHMESTAEEVAFLYKKRWGIELLFKKMKQNFQLHYFYGENENAIRTQVWCTLIAQLLLTVLQKMAKAKKAFSVVATLIRIHLISMLDVCELLRKKSRGYVRKANPPPATEQMSFDF